MDDIHNLNWIGPLNVVLYKFQLLYLHILIMYSMGKLTAHLVARITNYLFLSEWPCLDGNNNLMLSCLQIVLQHEVTPPRKILLLQKL